MLSKLLNWFELPEIKPKELGPEWQSRRGSKWKDMVTNEKYKLAVSRYDLHLINKETKKIKTVSTYDFKDEYIEISNEEYRGNE